MAKVKYGKLKAFMVENGITQNDIGNLLGISASETSQKLNLPYRDFNLAQARSICCEFALSMDEFFCAEQVAIEQQEA